MLSPDVLERAQRDGCGCPEWVVMCAHWEGRVLWLTSRFPECDCCVNNYEFSVIGPGVVENDGCPYIVNSRDAPDYLDLAAAEAEFYRLEAKLVRSES